MSDFVSVVLPEHFDLVVGDTFQLFYRGIVEAVDPFHYDILAVCEKGRNFPRYFEFTPEEEGEYQLEIRVCANDKSLLARETTRLCVYRAKSSPKETVNILCVGDSLTAPGIWVEEAHRRLTAKDGNPCGLGLDGFRFIGTCKQGEVGYEGYGGWRWDNFLGYTQDCVWISCKHNKEVCDQHSIWKESSGVRWFLETVEIDRLKLIRLDWQKKPAAGTVLTHCANAQNMESIVVLDSYNEHSNPFWNEENGNVDFKCYCDKHGFDRIDAAYIMLTWNGSPNPDNVTGHSLKMAAQGKQFVDILHSQYPKAKVRIMGLILPSINGGAGTNYGAVLPYCDDYGMVRFVLELNRVYQAWVQEEHYRDFVEFINISGQFDTDYNMPYTEKCVNTRNSKKEIIGINGCHPLSEGYLQIADAAYRNMVKSFAYVEVQNV